mmetsp:Transcript_5712/g.7878  ORF Transcript_5712/g.7878 Transcript_5712/m.7878 type:complete len:487 (+) Transcript_5712:109-1569(+)
MAFNQQQRGIRPNEMFIKRREQEAKREEFNTSTQAVAHLQRLAKWESRSDALVNTRLQKDRLQQLSAQAEAELNQRRHRLAALYNAEMEQWTQEVLNNVETPEDRKKRMKERALALAAAREEKRKAFVEDAYNRRWRDACDDARALDSKAMLDYVVDKRQEQLLEKELRSQIEKEEEQKYLAMVMQNVSLLEAKERAQVEALHSANRKMRSDLDLQVKDIQQRRDHLHQAKQDGEREQILQWQQEKMVEDEREAQKRREMHQRGTEIRSLNQQKAMEREYHKQVERNQDLLLLDHALRMERANEMQEQAKKEEEKRVMKEYHEYLKEQMVKEAEDTAMVDAIRLQEENRIWDQREADLRAQDEARQYLMQQVDMGRQEQIRHKMEELEKDRRREQDEAMKAKIEYELMEQEERNRQMQRKMQNVDNASRLKQQINANYHNQRLEDQEKYLSAKQMQMMERKHQQRLKEQAGVVETYKPLKHTQWYT